MSEDELMKLIRKTVLEWAMEEHLSNQDDEICMRHKGQSICPATNNLYERYEENAQTFMQNLREKLGDDLAHLQELPL